MTTLSIEESIVFLSGHSQFPRIVLCLRRI